MGLQITGQIKCVVSLLRNAGNKNLLEANEIIGPYILQVVEQCSVSDEIDFR